MDKKNAMAIRQAGYSVPCGERPCSFSELPARSSHVTSRDAPGQCAGTRLGTVSGTPRYEPRAAVATPEG